MLIARRSLLLFALCAAPSLASARPSLDASRLAELERWEVLVFSDPHGNGIDRGKAIGVFDATPEEVFRVVTDYARWQDYLPRVRTSSVVERDAVHTTVDLTAELPWPAGRSKITALYTHERLPGDIYRIKFGMLHGQMKQYLGQLYIEPWAPGRTAVTYEVVAEPDVLAPRSTINRSIKKSAAGFVHALRQRINDMHRLGYLHPIAPPAPPAEHSPLVGAPPATCAVQADANAKR
jgi:ribosome-associated toxin RatA of RatAB toxin-antitoxin module